MDTTDKLLDMLCTELDEIAEKGEMSAGDLDTVYKLIVSKEKLLRTNELEEGLGYSQDGMWRAEGTTSRDSGNSYASRRRHYVRGHYSRGRYSMDDGRRKIADEIRGMIDDGSVSSNDRMILEKAMEIMQK